MSSAETCRSVAVAVATSLLLLLLLMMLCLVAGVVHNSTAAVVSVAGVAAAAIQTLSAAVISAAAAAAAAPGVQQGQAAVVLQAGSMSDWQRASFTEGGIYIDQSVKYRHPPSICSGLYVQYIFPSQQRCE